MSSRKPFLLRIDPQLWAELESWAKDELRSVNSQIEYVLKQAVLKRKGGHNTGKELLSGPTSADQTGTIGGPAA